MIEQDIYELRVHAAYWVAIPDWLCHDSHGNIYRVPPCHAEPDKFEYFRNWMTDSQPATFELHQYVIGIYRIESVRGAKLGARALLASVDITDVHLHLSFQ